MAVPELRFPEFRDSEEWSKKKLGTVATLHKGKGISKAEIVADGMQRCIRYGELYTIYREIIYEITSSTNADVNALFLSKKNDVIIPASGETKIDIAKASCVMSDDIALGGDLNVIRSSQNGVFLSYQLNGPLRLSIAKVAQGDTVVHLYPSQIELLDIQIPSLSEQQKIADCLSSLDELVSAQAQKIEALKGHKKALMQQLFPSEGETVPRLRFAEFMDDLTGKALGDLTVWQSGGTPSKADSSYWDGDIPWISASSMKDIKYSSSDLKISENGLKNGSKLAKKDDLLILVRGSMLFNKIPVGIAMRDIAFNQDVKAIRTNTLLKPEYLLQWFLGCQDKLLGMVTETGIGAGKLDTQALQSIQIFLPSLPEQQKIADCLSSLDELITTHTQKLDALKALKKGLMQRLFPAAEEAKK